MALGIHVTIKAGCDWLLAYSLCIFSRNKQACESEALTAGLFFLTAKMPKRACPFPETFSSQYKIHIGQQELNNYGVFGNKYRQEIYGEYMLADILVRFSEW